MTRQKCEIVEDVGHMERSLSLLARAVTGPGRLYHQAMFDEAFQRVCADVPGADVIARMIGTDIVEWLRSQLTDDQTDKPETEPPGEPFA